MLGSAILVCLSGLMFTSSLFIGDLKPLYQVCRRRGALLTGYRCRSRASFWYSAARV